MFPRLQFPGPPKIVSPEIEPGTWDIIAHSGWNEPGTRIGSSWVWSGAVNVYSNNAGMTIGMQQNQEIHEVWDLSRFANTPFIRFHVAKDARPEFPADMISELLKRSDASGVSRWCQMNVVYQPMSVASDEDIFAWRPTHTPCQGQAWKMWQMRATGGLVPIGSFCRFVFGTNMEDQFGGGTVVDIVLMIERALNPKSKRDVVLELTDINPLVNDEFADLLRDVGEDRLAATYSFTWASVSLADGSE